MRTKLIFSLGLTALLLGRSMPGQPLSRESPRPVSPGSRRTLQAIAPRATSQTPSAGALQEALGSLLGEQRHLPLWVTTLRSQLQFAGAADRPDCPPDHFWLYLKELESPRMVTAGDTIWFDFDPSCDHLRLQWSSEESGRLKAEVKKPFQESVTLFVAKRGDPLSIQEIVLSLDRSSRERSWELGGHLVDSRLLMKMEGRWFGPDQLLAELLGLKEGCQHIQFGFGNRAYAIPTETGGTLHWSKGRWHRGCSPQHPLLRVDSGDASKLNLTLWDEQGFARSELSLPKLFSPGDLASISNQLKFKGLRGQRRAQLSLGAQTLVAREGDWLIKKQEGWTVLNSAEARKSWLFTQGLGETIVIQTIERRKGRPRLIAKIYNASHGECMTTECQLTSPPAPAPNLLPHP